MLVGEHGRVIPIRRFREIAFTIIGIALFSSLALAVLGLLHVQQGRTVGDLQNQLEQLQQQASDLKNERDVLKAKLVIGSIQSNSIGSGIKEDGQSDSGLQESSTKAQEPVVVKAAEVESKTLNKPIRWQADIRQFDTRFNPGDNSLKAQFVIHNVSQPKDTLTGRTVLILKAGDDPLNWRTTPNVSLKEGKPSGLEGRPFEVKNYRTMDFASVPQKASHAFKKATVYVFLENGELLLARDFDIQVTTEPPALKEQSGSTKPRTFESIVPKIEPNETKTPSDSLHAEDKIPEEEGAHDQEAPQQGTAPSL